MRALRLTGHVIVADELALDHHLRVPRAKIVPLLGAQAQLGFLLHLLACCTRAIRSTSYSHT